MPVILLCATRALTILTNSIICFLSLAAGTAQPGHGSQHHNQGAGPSIAPGAAALPRHGAAVG